MVIEYKHLKCYSCGQPMLASSFNDTYAMRVEGVLHQVPVWSVPCAYCTACDVSITSSDSDEAVMWSYNKYLTDAGLNTTYLRARRFVRRLVLGVRDRIMRDYYRSRRTFRRETA